MHQVQSKTNFHCEIANPLMTSLKHSTTNETKKFCDKINDITYIEKHITVLYL